VDKWNFLVIPNGNDKTTNPAHKLFARQRHSVAANTPVESQFRRCRRHFPSVSALPLNLGPWKGSIDENPSHRGFGFVRVQFAGAGWMYLPMRRWADATPLQQHPRYRAPLHGDVRPGRAFNRPNQSAEDPATGHNILPTGPDLRPVRKLPLATGLPIILNSNQSSIDLTDAAANGRPRLVGRKQSEGRLSLGKPH
jgi:hypothetical protein